MGLRSSPLAYTILPSSAGGLGLFQSKSCYILYSAHLTGRVAVRKIMSMYMDMLYPKIRIIVTQ